MFRPLPLTHRGRTTCQTFLSPCRPNKLKHKGQWVISSELVVCCVNAYYRCWRRKISGQILALGIKKIKKALIFPRVCCWCALAEELDVSGRICVDSGLHGPRSHVNVLSGWVEGGLPFHPLPSQPVCSLSCRSASPLADDGHTGTLPVPDYSLSTACGAIVRPSIPFSFFSAALALDPFPESLLFQRLFFFLLLCNVPVRAYRRTNDNRAELSDRTNCGIICIYSFFGGVDSLAGGMYENLQPFVYSRVSTRNCLRHTFSARLCKP